MFAKSKNVVFVYFRLIECWLMKTSTRSTHLSVGLPISASRRPHWHLVTTAASSKTNWLVGVTLEYSCYNVGVHAVMDIARLVVWVFFVLLGFFVFLEWGGRVEIRS